MSGAIASARSWSPVRLSASSWAMTASILSRSLDFAQTVPRFGAVGHQLGVEHARIDGEPPAGHVAAAGRLLRPEGAVRVAVFPSPIRSVGMPSSIIRFSTGQRAARSYCPSPSNPQVVRCITWLRTISATGATIVIPSIPAARWVTRPFW